MNAIFRNDSFHVSIYSLGRALDWKQNNLEVDSARMGCWQRLYLLHHSASPYPRFVLPASDCGLRVSFYNLKLCLKIYVRERVVSLPSSVPEMAMNGTIADPNV